VPCDVADGRIKSVFKTKTSAKSDAKPELQKGVKFAHVMLYVGELGKFALEFVAPRTPQRDFCFDLIDFMVRGVAREFSEEELTSLENKGKILARRLLRLFPGYMCTIVVHMILDHLSWHIRQFGPLSSNWTMFLERHLRVMKNATPLNGRTVTRIDLADTRQRISDDTTPSQTPMPT
jgi:hypothetical protein